MAQEESTRSERILAALLAISVDNYLRETGIAKPKPRSIDRMLSDVGLAADEIASVLGKTERAVYLQLASDKKASKKGRKDGRAG